MRFQPKTEEECRRLLSKGVWDYEILQAEDHKSKAGNEMLKLSVRVWDKEGKSTTIFDYLAFDHKVRHFAYSNGLDKQYEQGEIPAHLCAGRTGKCLGGIEVDRDGAHPDKNKIIDYIIANDHMNNNIVIQTKDLDDDIPF